MPSILNTTDENFIKDFDSLLLTKREADQDVDDIVSKILDDVKNHGDSAVIELTAKYDRLNLTSDTLAFSETEIDEAIALVTTEEREALELAATETISSFLSSNEKERSLASGDESAKETIIHLGSS